MTSDAPAALTRFEFTSGLQRGSHLALYPRCLVHRSESQLETVPLVAIASLRVAFLRDPRKLRWGIALVVIALLLLAIAGPLGSLAAESASDMASGGTQGVARALYGLFRFLEGVASVMPAAALACALGGAALAIYGWRGTMLLDFAEMVSERLAALAR